MSNKLHTFSAVLLILTLVTQASGWQELCASCDMAEMEISCHMPADVAPKAAHHQAGELNAAIATQHHGGELEAACCCAITLCPELPEAPLAVFVVEKPVQKQVGHVEIRKPVEVSRFYSSPVVRTLSPRRDNGASPPLFALNSSYLI